ncbi:MAG TPA: hydroxymethylbilane synthase [Bryobacteraceae bacterium]|nr:hydroxymethylbilane synthase [Bryobacteraceae bacterium]
MIIGSRGSALALWQARYVAAQLQKLGVAARIEIIRTTGDRMQTETAAGTAGKGLFTKEIEEALLTGAIDVAVHSLKDLPTEMPEGLALAAVPEREDARDVLVGARLDGLKLGARVGTSSDRRAAQLRILRPDLSVEPIRGNVDTRLRKRTQGEFDGIVLALAGLRRLGLEREAAEILNPEQMCPAPGQGALGIETRSNDPAHEVCATLNHVESASAVACERAVLAGLGGGCQLPLGAYAVADGLVLRITAIVVARDGSRSIRAQAEGPIDDPVGLGESVAEDLQVRGAASLLS